MAKRGKNMEFARQVAKNKPALKDAIDNLESYSIEEIRLLKVPGWAKQVLIKEKEMSALRLPGALTPEQIAERMIQNSQHKGI